MHHTLQLLVRNHRPTPRTAQYSRPSRQHSAQQLDLSQYEYHREGSPQQRLRRLEGNLKMLEKKYKDNLKEGFDHKIKTYRIQAVVERKMLRQAIQQTQKAQIHDSITSKLEQNSQLNQLQEEHSAICRFRKQERQRFLRERNKKQKKRVSLLLQQQLSQLEHTNRSTHDRILSEQQFSDRKRTYFDHLRRNSLKKQTMATKRELLDRIVDNTQKLRQLKDSLWDMQTLKQEVNQGRTERGATFLTL